MSGRNVNIYLQEDNYEKVKNLIAQRRVSQLINQLVTEWSQKEQRQSKEELRKEMIEGYKRNAKNQNLQNELKALEAASAEDVLITLEKRENGQSK